MERDIRKALKARVEAWGGEVRAVAWLGRRHAPDVLCLFPGYHGFVETKAPGGKPSAAQAREHERMRAAGCTVDVISTLAQLDRWSPPAPMLHEQATDFCWLVEMFHRGGNSTGRYHTGFTDLHNQSRSTTDPHAAKRYYARVNAENVAADLNVHMMACEWRAVEHGFDISTAAPADTGAQDALDALEREALRRLMPWIRKAMQGLVFTADKAGEVAADMQILRDWLNAPDATMAATKEPKP